MNRKIFVITFVSGIVAMAFAGVALSLGGGSDISPVGPDRAAEVLRAAPGTEERTRASPRVDGQTWGMRSFTNVRGEFCLSNDVPGELTGTGCTDPEKAFADGPLYAIHGARQISAPYPKQDWDNAWVYGIAHPAIKELALLNMDCSAVGLSLANDGTFKHVVAKAELDAGRFPYKLIGRGAAGEVLVEKDVAIGLTRNAKGAGREGPRPLQACS